MEHDPDIDGDVAAARGSTQARRRAKIVSWILLAIIAGGTIMAVIGLIA